MAGSELKYGHVTASLIVGKLSRADRQNTLAAALKEYGALRRTVYAARYLSREDYRRKISHQLNKGESIHALRRDVFYAHEGAVRRRHLQHQTEQAWCLTLATNAVIAWTTEYLGLAVTQFRAQGRRVDDVLLAHISPSTSTTNWPSSTPPVIAPSANPRRSSRRTDAPGTDGSRLRRVGATPCAYLR